MNRRALVVFVVLSLAVALAGCDWRTLDPPGAVPLRYRDKIFSTVVMTPDITYGSAQNLSHQTVTLKLDMYEPKNDKVTKRPVIVWVHGGSFCCGDKTSSELVDEANTFAKKGYLNVSINYRLEPDGCSAAVPTDTCIEAIKEATADAQTAVRWLRTNAAKYRVDPNRIAIGGSSAGAITALDVGYDTSEKPAVGVRAAVALSGANILTPISAGDAPALMFHGTADTVVPFAWASRTLFVARSKGLDAFLTSWPGEGHVPYLQNRAQILKETRDFLYWEMDLAHGAV
jgi:acetyl esterase/lipase